MLTANDTVQFWGDNDIVSYGNNIVLIRNPSFNPVGDWPGSAPSLDSLLHEASLARISYLQITSDASGARKTVAILSGRVVITGTIFTDKDSWRLHLNKKNGIKFASNTLRGRILSRSVRVKHDGVICVSGDTFRREYEQSSYFWDAGDYCKSLVQLFEKGMPKNSNSAADEELLEDIQPLDEGEEQVLDALQQFVEAEHELEEQQARETAPFAYYACEAAPRQVVYRQFFTLTCDQEDLDRLRELKPSLLSIENPALVDPIMASVVNLSPSQDKPQILISIEKQVCAEDIPRSGRLWLTALPTLKNVRCGVVETLRGRQSPNRWLVPVSAQSHSFSKLKPEMLPVPKTKFPPNESQVKAINAGAGTDDFLLVLGPPGTGKTTVILRWAEHFVSQGKRVLVTSQNNKAVDNVLERLAEKESLECVRLGDETKVSSSVRDILIDNYAVNIQKKLVADLDATISSLTPFQKYLDSLPPLFQQYNNIRTKEMSLNERLTSIRSREIPELEDKVCSIEELIKRTNGSLSKKKDEVTKIGETIARREGLNSIFRFFLKPFINKNKQKFHKVAVEVQNLEAELAQSTRSLGEYRLLLPALASEAEIIVNELARLEVEGKALFSISQPAEILRSLNPLKIELGKNFNLEKATKAVWDRRAKYLKIESIVKEWQSLMTSERQQALYSLLLSFVDVVGATCIGINTNKAFKDTVFDVVIVDESGQIQLHNVMVPLSRGPKAILVGDHKQLPPVVDPALLDEVEERGSHFDKELLKKSWFELLWDQTPDDRKVMLNTQFRCPAVISNFISKAYYEDKYFAGSGMEKKEPIFTFFSSTLVFIDTSGLKDRFESKIESNVTGNRKETEIVISILNRALVEQPSLGDGEIGVIVPYKNHAMEVRDAIRKQRKKGTLNTISVPLDELVATVDSFQGQERDLIVFPFSRSNNSGSIGFLKDWRRLNVAMTRTKKQLVMIGDLSTLTMTPRHREMDEMESTFKQSMLFLKEYTREHGQLIDAAQWLNSAQADRR